MNGFTLLEVLSRNERVLVWSDETEGTIYTWNQSVTLQAWYTDSKGFWQELDLKILSRQPASIDAARKLARRWAECE